MSDFAVDLSEVSDGELLELMVPVESINRRLLVVWLYLFQGVKVSLKEFNDQISNLAERELQKRASDSATGERLGQATEMYRKIGAKRESE